MSLQAPVMPMADNAIIDEAAVALGQDLGALMERAGAALFREAQRLAPAGAIVVACGPGNNGGDGYVCARLLAEAGRAVRVWPVVAPASALCVREAARLGSTIQLLDSAPAAPPALLIDAVLGAGAVGAPREPVASALLALRRLCHGAPGCPVLAADVPSGIGSDAVLPATLTLCFQVAKAELLRSGSRPAATREFKTVDIGMAPAAYLEVQPVCMRRFPPLKKHGHKGSHGELLIIGGGVFPGALEFCARAAVMTGCDLVRAWTAGETHLPPTVVAHRQDGAWLKPADPAEIMPLLVRAGAVLIGPGLGRQPGCHEAAQQALSLALEMGIPVVLDADGIHANAEILRELPEGDHRILITPHRSEARNLLGGPAENEDIHAFARRDRVMLAKAPVDLVSDGWRWQLNPRGNARLAVGGSGDVLAGLAAGLMARGAAPFDAARMAVLWVTSAGDELWQEQGPCYDTLGLIARLPQVLRQYLTPLGMWPPVV